MDTITRKSHDVENFELSPSRIESFSGSESPVNKFWWRNLVSYGVEVQGIQPIPVEHRTDTRIANLFSVWFTMMISPLAIVTGMTAPLTYGLNLRDASLSILFFSLLSCAPPAYLSILGPKTGLRQLVQARYSFGLYGILLIVLLNLATITGFVVIMCVVGGQTLSAVNKENLSWNVGIVIVGLIGLLVSFFGIKVLHQFERYAWIPATIAIIIAVGCDGKQLYKQVEMPAGSASQILSFGSIIAGYIIPCSGMASDFGTYILPDASPWRVFTYVFAGLVIGNVPLLVLGAAIGGAMPNVPSWASAYETNSGGGILAAMLEPVGGFGRFLVVILALSTAGNQVACMYSITLNLQMLMPALARVPRYFFAVVITAIAIPVSIQAAKSFFASLENFIGIVSYWTSAFVGIVVTEHVIFRRMDCTTYEHAIWDSAKGLPTGIAAVAAGVLSFGLIIPCMNQLWYTGPIAKITGDIGFEVAFFLSVFLYIPFRTVEVKVRGGL